MRLYQVHRDWDPEFIPTVLAIDTEGTTLDIFDPEWKLLCVSWAYSPDEGYVAHLGDLPHALLAWLGLASVLKVGHNIKYDMKALMRAGVAVNPTHPVADTRLIRHLMDESRNVGESLKAQVREWGLMANWTSPLERWQEIQKSTETPYKARRAILSQGDIKTPVLPENAAQGTRTALRGDLKGTTAWPPPDEILLPYAPQDAVATYRLFQKLWSMLTPAQRRLAGLLFRVEGVFAKMELNGLKLDTDKLRAEEIRAVLLIKLKEHVIRTNSTIENVNSDKQIAKWLYQERGLTCLKRTEKGGQSVDEDALTRLRRNAPPEVDKVIGWVLEYRGLVKLVEKISGRKGLLTNAHDDVIHTTFNLSGTDTGRCSSSPNVQNIERRGPLRKCFISRFGKEG